MAAAKLHLNGVTYDLWSPHESATITQLAEQLRPTRPPVAAEKQPYMHRTTRTHTVEVRFDGERVLLTIDLDDVWASAAWIVFEQQTDFAVV